MLSIEIHAHVVKAMWFLQCLVSGWPALTIVNLRRFLGTKSEKYPLNLMYYLGNVIHATQCQPGLWAPEN